MVVERTMFLSGSRRSRIYPFHLSETFLIPVNKFYDMKRYSNQVFVFDTFDLDCRCKQKNKFRIAQGPSCTVHVVLLELF